jgi:hypothetical protein
MTEQNPRAFIGANNPPPFNQAEVDTLNAEAGQFLDVAGEWIEAGDITDDGQAQNLNDFIAGVKKRKIATDKARATAKKPHDDAGKLVQAAYKPIITKLETVVSKTSPILTAWLTKKEAARQAEIRRQQEEARLAQQEADRQEAAALARNDISGEIDAQTARDEADQLAKDADRASKTKANVASATGGGRTASLRTFVTAELNNARVGFMRYAEHPDLIACLVSLAEREARAKNFDPEADTIPGFTLHVERRAV